MEEQDKKALTRAVQLMENPSFPVKVANTIGTPIEKAIALLPHGAREKIGSLCRKAIHGALKLSLRSMDISTKSDNNAEPSNWWHTGAVAVTGGVAGFFGLGALAIELPISTTIMMRSIADIARSEGADLSDIVAQLECVQVLAFGGLSNSDDGADIGYFIVREAMAEAVEEAATHIAVQGLGQEGAPALVRLITQIAERYSINITEKTAAQFVPVIGALGGALINTFFIDHFQDMAEAHFSIRRLERKYGEDAVRVEYASILKILRGAKS